MIPRNKQVQWLSFFCFATDTSDILFRLKSKHALLTNQPRPTNHGRWTTGYVLIHDRGSVGRIFGMINELYEELYQHKQLVEIAMCSLVRRTEG
jgi:hypothetical protein